MRVDWIGDRLTGEECRRGNDDALTYTRTNVDGREQAGRRTKGQADEVRWGRKSASERAGAGGGFGEVL